MARFGHGVSSSARTSTSKPDKVEETEPIVSARKSEARADSAELKDSCDATALNRVTVMTPLEEVDFMLSTSHIGVQDAVLHPTENSPAASDKDDDCSNKSDETAEHPKHQTSDLSVRTKKP